MKFLFTLPALFFLGLCLAEELDIVPDLAKREYLRDMAQDVSVQAFLNLLARGEGTIAGQGKAFNSSDEYRVTYCNQADDLMPSFRDHPRIRCCLPCKGKELCSDASGRYMFLSKTWDWVSPKLDLGTFCPANQDIAAVYLLENCGALERILVGDIKGAIKAASRYWAPMPGNGYGQPQMEEQSAIDFYKKQLKILQTGRSAL